MVVLVVRGSGKGRVLTLRRHYARPLVESGRGYKKAPEGWREKETFRGPSDVQDNQGTIVFYRLLFTPGYRFTKGLTQNLNLRTNLKHKYNIKSPNYIQPTFRFQASFLYYWTMSFTFSTWSVV